MSNLIKSDVIKRLPVNLQRFAEARVSNPPFERLHIGEQKRECLKIVTMAHKSTGDKGNEEELLAFQTTELLDCLKEKYGQLTVPEVYRALEMLIAGEFGPFMGLFKKSYYQALKAYYELPQRKICMDEYLKLTEPPKLDELSQDEKLKRNKDACIYSFNEYKKTGEIIAGYYKVYGVLMELGLIKWTNEEKEEIKTPVKKEYLATLDKSLKRRIIKQSAYDELLQSLNTNPTYIGMLRKAGLKRYFDSIEKLEF